MKRCVDLRCRMTPWMVTCAAFLFVLGAVLQPRGIARAVPIEDDEEITAGDIAFDVPSEVAREKRREAGREGFSLLTGASLFGGVDGNVYRSPSPLREASDAWGTWGLARADARSGRLRSLSTVSWRIFQYPEFPNANSNRLQLREWLRRRLSRTVSIEGALDVRRRNDDATTIEGLAYPEDYANWKYRGEGSLRWRMSKGHSIEAGGAWTVKNYDERVGVTSLDWHEGKVNLRYRGRLSRGRYLVLAGATGTRDYDVSRASDRTGGDSSLYPARRHRYNDLSAGVDLPLGRGGEAGIEYSYAAKEDLFQGYESYHVHRIALQGDMPAGGRWGVRGDAVWSRRHYDNRLATDGSPLEYMLLELGLGARYNAGGPWWLFAHGSGFIRDSNREAGIYYRDYSGVVTTVGVSWFR